ncbi:MAG: glutamyl-tRNA reductase [Planctomycetota bacterium]|nr:glutamyl-tRNA reductase [Planctomycetota bacterium]
MKLQMVGCSHHNAPLEIRERLAFNTAQAAEALERWRQEFPQTEAVLLSTCNRVEVYTATDNSQTGPSHHQMVEFLAQCHGLDLTTVFDDLFEQSGEGMIRHLFTVAASLDSMVVGEPQILSQVKQAYRMALEHRSAGALSHEIFQAALHVAKRVANETAINEHRVSIPSVAVADFAREIFERFDDKKVLVIGAGEMAEETLRYLKDEGANDITVINHNNERAVALSEKIGGRAAGWDQLEELLVAADLVVSTTGASRPVITQARFKQIEDERYQRPLFILDLAVPRDFDPAISDSLGVYLYSIDDLERACQKNRQHRDKELPVALEIVEEETQRFMSLLHHRAAGPIIQRLRQGWQSLRDQELKRLFNKLPELDDRERSEIEQSFDRYVNKLLHPPLESLRDESQHGTPHGLIDALKRLFHLKD